MSGGRRGGVRIPVLVVLAALAAIAIAALIVIWWLGAETARSGVADVSTSLRETIANNTRDQVLLFLRLPFTALESAVLLIDRGAFNIQRADGMELHSARGCTRSVVSLCQRFPAISGFYIGTEYGHWCSSDCHLPGADSSTWAFSTIPPIDQLRHGVPTWTIPCRYRADCAALYSAAASRLAAYCEDPSDPWAGRGRCTDRQRDCRPYWADGGLDCDSGARQCYKELQPLHATWAHAVNPSSSANTSCDPTLDGPREPCDDVCPQYNRTYYEADSSIKYVRYVGTRTDYDPRSRGWYKPNRGHRPQYGPGSKWYTGVYVCASSGLPCLSAVMPLHVSIPAVGATVLPSEGSNGAGLPFERARVEKVIFAAGPSTMYMLQLRYQGGAVSTVGPGEVRLACAGDNATCGAPGWEDSCAADCAEDSAAPGMPLELQRQRVEQHLVGVIAADYEAWSLTDILDSIRVGKTGGMFIVDQGDENDGLIAVSSSLSCKATRGGWQGGSGMLQPRCFVKMPGIGGVPETADPEQVSAYDSYAGPIVTGVMRGIFPTKKHRALRERVAASVGIGGEEYWVDAVPVDPEAGYGIRNVRWLLVVVLPQDDFLHDVLRNRDQTLYVSVAIAVVVGVVVVILAIGLISSPIHALLRRMDMACAMRVDEALAGKLPWTPLLEIRRLQDSFVILCRNLREYRSFLPQALLHVEEEADEDDWDATGASTPSDATAGIGSTPPLADSPDTRGPRPSTMSRPSSRHSMTSGHSVRLAAEETVRKVTVLVGNIRNLHARQGAALRAVLGTLIATASSITARTRGSLDGLVGDRVRCSWNAARFAGTHRARGAQAAATLFSTVAADAVLTLTLAVCSGDATCGHFGDVVARFPAIIGAVCSFAHAVERYAARSRAKPLCEECVQQEQPDVYYRWHSRVTYAKRSTEAVSLWEIVGQVEKQAGKEQEWMYELADSEAAAPFKLYNDAASTAIRGRRSVAIELLRAVPADSPLQPHAAELLAGLEAAARGAGCPTDPRELLDVGIKGPTAAAALPSPASTQCATPRAPADGLDVADCEHEDTVPGAAPRQVEEGDAPANPLLPPFVGS